MRIGEKSNYDYPFRSFPVQNKKDILNFGYYVSDILADLTCLLYAHKMKWSHIDQSEIM